MPNDKFTVVCVKSENRATEAERAVCKLQTEIDRLDGLSINHHCVLFLTMPLIYGFYYYLFLRL